MLLNFIDDLFATGSPAAASTEATLKEVQLEVQER